MRTDEGWNTELIAKGTPMRAQSLFVLAWFHAIIQERRLYIPQGWTKFYEFTSADLRTAMLIITRLCEAPNPDGSINWTDVHGLLIRLNPIALVCSCGGAQVC